MLRPASSAVFPPPSKTFVKTPQWSSPGLTQEVWALSIRAPHQPLSEGRVAEHPRLIPAFDEETRQRLHPLLEVVPQQLPSLAARVQRLKQLLVRHGVKGRQRHVENGHGALERRVGHELHVALQQVELRQRDGNHLVAGALDDQMTLLKEVKGQFEVQVRALAAGDEVGADFAHDDGVCFAVEGDVVEDVLAAVDAVLDVGVQVRPDLLAVWELIQADLGEGQQTGDLLKDKMERSWNTSKTFPSRFLWGGHVDFLPDEVRQFVFMCFCGSVVEHCFSSAKGCGFDSQGAHILTKNV